MIIFAYLCFEFYDSIILKIKIELINLIFKIPYTIYSCVQINIVSWYLSLQDMYEIINCILGDVMKDNNNPNFEKNIYQLLKHFKSVTTILNKVNTIYTLHILLIVIMIYLDILVNGFLILYDLVFQDETKNLGAMTIYSVQVVITSIFSICILSKRADDLKRKVSNNITQITKLTFNIVGIQLPYYFRLFSVSNNFY